MKNYKKPLIDIFEISMREHIASISDPTLEDFDEVNKPSIDPDIGGYVPLG